MKLPEGTHFAYTVTSEAWWFRGGEAPNVMVAASAKGQGGGVAWEFSIDEIELGGKPVTQVKVFDDAYAAFTQIPEFFAALADEAPATVAAVVALLDQLGAIDETDRVGPRDAMAKSRGPHDETVREALRLAVREASTGSAAERFRAALTALDGPRA
jgi:hypothetical protein